MTKNPLVSHIVLAYNQENFVRESVRSVISQTYSPLEIILSDDCSPDGTYDIMKAEVSAYNGPHKIVLNQNPKNLGLADHINQVWKLSNGEVIVAGAGDDIFLPNRTEKLIKRLQDTESPVDLVVSYFAEIDVTGKPTGFVKKDVAFVPDESIGVQKWRCGATGGCIAYNRKLFDKYGPLDSRVLAEDWVISFRAWLESGIAIVEKPLVMHRTHDNSISVMHRNVKSIHDKKKRRLRRRQAAENQLGIAKEWLQAWQISPRDDSKHIVSALQRLVSIRELQLRAHDSTKMEAFKLAMLLIKEGEPLNATKLMVRHVMRWD